MHEVDKPIILYAPTFSPSLTSAPDLEQTIQRMSEQGRYYWLIKFHPLMDPGIADAYRDMQGKNLEVVEEADIIPCLHAADIMVSDTSSVVAEFLLLDKPVITFKARTPAAHVVNIQQTGQLEPAIETMINNPQKNRQPSRDFVQQMHPYTDGMSSERVLDATEQLIADGRGGKKPKPLNLWRKLQVRKRLGYYRFR